MHSGDYFSGHSFKQSSRGHKEPDSLLNPNSSDRNSDENQGSVSHKDGALFNNLQNEHHSNNPKHHTDKEKEPNCASSGLSSDLIAQARESRAKVGEFWRLSMAVMDEVHIVEFPENHKRKR
eukprot:CAMPEP_0116938362 /NCGR_PEP_ID=MMETSP0467-20121206/32074_1 /TAXON_ID=283647 /ORGANISM="Mesodinium pulex, Strain SPMC105" /LENGTH=121 /DNA_ID=CAMNT_0004620393 /DNA_START=953 /DNA_END=1318 /DNA_ORIENTATION=+